MVLGPFHYINSSGLPADYYWDIDILMQTVRAALTGFGSSSENFRQLKQSIAHLCLLSVWMCRWWLRLACVLLSGKYIGRWRPQACLRSPRSRTCSLKSELASHDGDRIGLRVDVGGRCRNRARISVHDGRHPQASYTLGLANQSHLLL